MYTYVKIFEVIIILMVSVFFDIRYSKISNKITMPGAIIGIITNLIFKGTGGVLDSLTGMALPVVLLFILFALRFLGAGDIKLFAVLGSIMGVRFIAYCMAYSMIVGGIMAVVIIVVRKNSQERLKHLLNYLKLCFLSLRLHTYQSFDKKSTGLFRFSYAIAGGTLIALMF